MATVRGDHLWRCATCGYTTDDAGPDECVDCEKPLLLVEAPTVARVIAAIPLEVTLGRSPTPLALPDHVRDELGRVETSVKVLGGFGPLLDACRNVGRVGPWAMVHGTMTTPRRPQPGETLPGHYVFFMLGGFESLGEAVGWADRAGFSDIPWRPPHSFAGVDWDVAPVVAEGREDWTEEGVVADRVRFGEVPPPGDLPAERGDV